MTKRTVILLLLALVAAMILPMAAAAAPETPGVTFTVNSTADPGNGVCNAFECTLREAIIAANANGASQDTIAFNIAGGGPHIITLASALQAISQPLILDGLTQAGSTCGSSPPFTPKIVVNGSGLGAGNTGLVINSSNVQVQGLVIQRFSSHGVVIQGSNNTLRCDYIGTNSAGSLDLGNGGIGVYVNNGANNTIASNLISGNNSYGIYLGGAAASGNIVRQNRIGTDAFGAFAIPNGSTGVLVEGAPNTTVGGSTAAGNVISGNSGHGVAVNTGATGTKVSGNIIGLNSVGAAKVPNTGAGVSIAGVGGIVIGGATASAGNVISGNGGAGVLLQSGASAAQIYHNIIGLNALANVKLGNDDQGIYVNGTSNHKIGLSNAPNLIGGNGQEGIFVLDGSGNTIYGNRIGLTAAGGNAGNGFFGVHLNGGANNLVGGAGSMNTIAFNAADGIYVFGATSGNALADNEIYSNGGLGIDLGADGVTPNDNGDGDSGPNGLQNFPVLTFAATLSGGSPETVVQGSLNSLPGQQFRITFYTNPTCDPSTFGEGAVRHGATTTTTGANGNATFSYSWPNAVTLGHYMVATATQISTSNTSEFSQCIPVQILVPTPTPTSTPTPTPTPPSTATPTPTSTPTNQNPRVYLPLILTAGI